MSAYYNVFSLIFGVASWVIPFVAIKKVNDSRCLKFSVLSFLCCAAALILQFIEISHRAGIGDWSAIGDTIGAKVGAAVVLVVVNVAINAVAVMEYRRVNVTR